MEQKKGSDWTTSTEEKFKSAVETASRDKSKKFVHAGIGSLVNKKRNPSVKDEDDEKYRKRVPEKKKTLPQTPKTGKMAKPSASPALEKKVQQTGKKSPQARKTGRKKAETEVKHRKYPKSLVRFVGEEVETDVNREPDQEEKLLTDAKQAATQVKATKEGIKSSIHTAAATAQKSKQAVKQSAAVIKNRRKLYEQARERLGNLIRRISKIITDPLLVVKGLGLGGVVGSFAALLLVMTVAISSMVSAVTIKTDEEELTKTWAYLTELDTDMTLQIQTGTKSLEVNGAYATREEISIYSDINQVLAYLDNQYGDYQLEGQLSTGLSTKSTIQTLYDRLVNFSSQPDMDKLEIRTISEIIASDEEVQEQMSVMAEAGQYAGLEVFSSPFPDEDALYVMKRYGYSVEDGKKIISDGITLQAEENKTVLAPMSGEISTSEKTVTIINGKQELVFQNITASVSNSEKVERGTKIGKTVEKDSLVIEYKKSGTTLNAGFYFPNVQYLQSTSFGYAFSGGFDEATFRFIISTRCNVFSGKADKIIAEAKKAGVSPVIFAAIMIHESAWGTSQAIREHNNPSGQMDSSGIIHYATLDEGIEATGRTLKNLIIEQKLQTVEALGSVYCPVGAANDPLGLNKNWVPAIKQFMEILGGSGDMSLLWSGASGKAGKLLEYAESLYGKGVIYTQGTQRGAFPYHDCSSFVTKAMQEAGLNTSIGSTEYLYSLEGTVLQPISKSEVRAGDIFVWGTKGASSGDFGHTGIFLDDGGKTIIHCTGSVNQNGNVVKTPFDGYYGTPSLAPVYFYRVK